MRSKHSIIGLLGSNEQLGEWSDCFQRFVKQLLYVSHTIFLNFFLELFV